MSRRSKSKIRDFKIYLSKNVFNGRYIVRNTTIATILVTVIALFVGIGSSISENKRNKRADAEAIEASVINYSQAPSMNPNSASMLRAQLENENETALAAKESEMVAATTHEFDTKFITNSSEVNVRAEASTDSAIVGKLTYGNVGDILSSEGDWYKISSGEVTGYIKANLVLTGVEAEKYAESYKTPTGSINASDVAIWSEPSRDSSILGTAYQTVTYKVDIDVTNTLDGWVCVYTEDGTKGYVGAAYIDVTTGYTAATPYVETEQQLDVEESEEDDTKEVTEQKEEAAETSSPQTTSNKQEVVYTARGSISLSEEDVNLIATVVTLEAGGESYEGQLAVVNVILNRLQSGRYGSTVSDVVYAPSQFTVVNKSSFQSTLNGGAQASCVQAVHDACSGTNNVGSYTGFKPTWNIDTSSLGSYIQIGNHIFY